MTRVAMPRVPWLPAWQKRALWNAIRARIRTCFHAGLG
jgi:hypothetical protein